MSEVHPPHLRRDPRRPFLAAPFTRLARTHAFSIAGDSLFTVGLAGSVFFSVPFNEARWKVGLYLVLTFAPFAVAAPLIGPVIDRLRGGRRWVIIGSLALRALLCVLIVRDISHLTFYLEAFLMLVFAKSYLISRAALVPTTVRSDKELVEANSKLSLLSGIAAVAAGGPGLVLVKLGGARWSVGLAGVVFALGAVFALRLPKVVVAATPAGDAERAELRSAGIRLAGSAMAIMRVSVGFLVLFLAFSFKGAKAPLWYLVVAGTMAQAGVLGGAALAPRLREATDESRIMAGSLVATAAAALVSAYLGGLPAAAVMSFVLGVTSGTSKLAFDALVQRDAPDANRGRLFARFETRFQLAWVLGAFLPVVVSLTDALGYLIIAIMITVAFASYVIGHRRVAHGVYDWDSPGRKLISYGKRRVDASRAGSDGGRLATEEPDCPTAPYPDRPLAPEPDRPLPPEQPRGTHGDGDETVVEQATLPFGPDPVAEDTLVGDPAWRIPGK